MIELMLLVSLVAIGTSKYSWRLTKLGICIFSIYNYSGVLIIVVNIESNKIIFNKDFDVGGRLSNYALRGLDNDSDGEFMILYNEIRRLLGNLTFSLAYDKIENSVVRYGYKKMGNLKKRGCIYQ